jgi:CheY-like chemotaxis protein
MDKRLALVVDDSRTARESLKRMLATHNLEVDTLESAPEALEYLKNTTPDVIFMDHMMPDMDGFQALEAIKGNPDTATIPIMMYTSKGGDLYVSQARALGAMGILPKQVQHAELFEVLGKLGLVKERRNRPGQAARPVLLDPPQEVALSATSEDILEIASQAAQSVQSHNHAQGQLGELLENYHHELLQDMRGLRNSLEQLTLDARPSTPGLLQPLLIVLAMLVPLLWIFNSGLETRDELATARQRIASLVASGEQLASTEGSASAALQKQLDDRDDYMRIQSWRFFDGIAWAINQGGGYPPDEEAFGDRRLVLVQELVSRLQTLGFRGVVLLESHLGEFCLDGSEGDGYTPAAADQSVTDCTRIGHPHEQMPGVGTRQSIAFANFLSSSPLLEDGNIRIEIKTYQTGQPRVPYPPLQADITAGEWNRIALANNRIDVQLIPEAGK